jgi:hypothetical protein
VTILFRPWNYAGVMVNSRTYRHLWTDVTSYDGLIEEGIDEQPWWRSRMLKTAAVLSFERESTRRWYGIYEAVGICITVALVVRKELQARLSSTSLYLQSVALRIVMISHQDERQMIHELRRTAICLLFQLYDHLPTSTSDNDGNVTAGKRRRKLLYWLRWAVITLLLAGVITAVQLLQIPVPEIAVQWLTAFAVGWGLVRVISIMEPNYQATIAAARELLGDASRLGGVNIQPVG